MHYIYLKKSLQKKKPKNDENCIECIWVNTKGKKNGIAIDVYYRRPNQTEAIDGLFASQITKVYRKHTTILMRHFNYTNINWETNSAPCGRS